jgi:hypothetical protein
MLKINIFSLVMLIVSMVKLYIIVELLMVKLVIMKLDML